MSRLFCAVGVVVCFAVRVLGHDLYLIPEHFRVKPGVSLRVGFHNGDAFPESEVAPKPERLEGARVQSATQRDSVDELHVDGNETVGTFKALGPGCLQLSVHTIPNFIELPAAKFAEYLKEEGLTHVLRWRDEHGQSGTPGRERYRKFAKSMVEAGRTDDFCQRPLGLTIEIVPLANVYALAAGARLPVRVLFRGKPAQDLQLEAAWAGGGEKQVQVVGRTDARGEIEVPLKKAGKWRLHTLRMERCAELKVADWESYWASLTFAVAAQEQQ